MANAARAGLPVATFTHAPANFLIPYACAMDTTYVTSANTNTATIATGCKKPGWAIDLAHHSRARCWPLAGFCVQSLRN